ncbi:hypothetical protein LPB140_10085 [Sphingorhabdus lutea]|uniref:NIF system FeS cluster assembly NifU N-terminal domain-containing protein n=1 Tax=Sphingorhabdus lutea TaxID=1913578 RepID=A0A1L3JD69_9SPHN|nr:iron-sulfur cluster assembly scaffold protein [Sphingorhabdus lutea]APG63076.1 hypothetical protein LPB140_10085 [Sphingorhabdus lutea]
MAEALYSLDILRLSMQLRPDDKLSAPQSTHEVTSRVCGGILSVELSLDENDRISDFAIRAKSCALGQASAAILDRHIIGLNVDEIRVQHAKLLAILGKDEATRHHQNNLDNQNSLDNPNSVTDIKVWPELSFLQSARDYPARHSAILLPYDALFGAMEKLKTP